MEFRSQESLKTEGVVERPVGLYIPEWDLAIRFPSFLCDVDIARGFCSNPSASKRF